jgi:hypothetical protein
VRRPDRIIVAEYLPPRGLSLVAAAELLGDGRRAIAAQLVDFAVRKRVAVSRTEKGFRFALRPLAPGAAPEPPDSDEYLVLEALFPGLREGAELTIRRGRNRALGERLRDPHREITARLIRDGLARERSFWAKLFRPLRREPVVATPAAYPLVDHLWGIHDYVRLAEKERFAMLQSPDRVASRVEVGPAEEAREVLLLNERLLPYAVLFGLEREWAAAIDAQQQSLVESLVGAVDVVEVLALVVDGADVVIAIADIASTVDAADALDGVGAFFGGLGSLLDGL